MRIAYQIYASVITLTILVSGSAICFAKAGYIQNHSVNQPYIRWVGQFPPVSGQSNEGVEKFKNVVLGRKEGAEISKPVAVLAKDTVNFLILDQAGMALFNVEKMRLGLPRVFRKRDSEFSSLVAMCFASDESVLFTDSYLSTVFMIKKDLKRISKLTDSILEQPTGIAYSVVNNQIWVVETAAHRISVFDLQGQLIKRIGNRGTGNGEFNYPTYIWIDSEGRVYIVDTMNFRIQIFDKNGEFISAFGEAGDASGYLGRPKGIATDSHNNIYVVDGLFHCVQVFDKDGRLLHRFGQQGRGPEEFWMPMGIYIDKMDYIYIADSYNSRIQIFQFVHE